MEIQNIKLSPWSDRESSSGYTYIVIPKTRGKPKIFLSEYLNDIGELVNLVKAKAGLLPPVHDLETFLQKPRVYPYDRGRLCANAAVYGLQVLAVALFLVVGRITWAAKVWDIAWIAFFGGLTLLAWRLLDLCISEVIVDTQGVAIRRHDRIIGSINWHALSQVEMPFNKTTFVTRDGRRLTVFGSLRDFDEFNQIIRQQKGLLGL